MEKKLMDELITKELEMIPRGDLPQNTFRSAYKMRRQHCLSHDPKQSAAEPFAEAVEDVRKNNPEFEPEVTDAAYFGWNP
ncbi:hypothetical protein BMS3Abin13_00760 [bacterium BMS3Abin13]|nr:hypothetical protein BMS3Abin13_00760 [bacterium BMS3Abin13]